MRVMHEFVMPSLGADMESGTFVEWLVQPGETVRRGQVVCVVETQKGAVEVEIWESGIVERLVAEPGQTIPVGGVMAIIAAEEEATATAPAAPVAPVVRVAEGREAGKGMQVAPVAAGARLRRQSRRMAPGMRPRDDEAATTLTAGGHIATSAGERSTPMTRERVKATPAARRRAAELGIELAGVAPGGAGGVVRLGDVERLASAASGAVVGAKRQGRPSGKAWGEASGELPSTVLGKVSVEVPGTLPAKTPGEVRGKPTREPAPAVTDARKAAMRDAIAAAMARSNRDIPHYYLGTTIDVEAALAWLEARNEGLPVAERALFAVPLLRAVVRALADVPALNGWCVEGRFEAVPSVNLGVAIALRGGGLVTPALRDAGRLGFAELSARLRDLLMRARSGRLRSSELTDTTITVTNLGDLGVETVYGVIYPPQVALVGFGRVTERPWAQDGKLWVARTVRATLAADHRVTDGAVGARFLARLAGYLHEPETLWAD